MVLRLVGSTVKYCQREPAPGALQVTSTFLPSNMPPPSAASSSKALAAILPQIASGHAYEAHQKARTFASRYVKASQFDTAIDVLFQSARELLKAGQLGSGTDLGSFLIEVYESKGEEVADESRGEHRNYAHILRMY